MKAKRWFWTPPGSFWRLLGAEECFREGDCFGYGRKKWPVDMALWLGRKVGTANQPAFRRLVSFVDVASGMFGVRSEKTGG